MSAQIQRDEAEQMAELLIVQSYRNFMADLDTDDLVGENEDALQDIAIALGIREMNDDDFDLVADLIDSARARIEVEW